MSTTLARPSDTKRFTVAGPTISRLLRDLAREGSLSRRDLAERNELPQPTVSKAVGDLKLQGVLVEQDRQVVGPGRPIIPLAWSKTSVIAGISIIDRNSQHYALSAVLTDPGGNLVRDTTVHAKLRQHEKHGAGLIKAIARLVDRLKAGLEPGEEIVGLGVSLSGHIDNDGNLVRTVRASTSDEGPVPLRQPIIDASGIDLVVVENDANALTVNEALYGDADASDLAVVAVYESGIGAGITDAAGRLARGATGKRAELGHLKVIFDAVPSKENACECGGFNCVEAVATPRRILEALRERDNDDVSLEDAAAQKYSSRELLADGSRAYFNLAEPFGWAGHLLGRAVSNWLQTIDASRLVVFLPDTFYYSHPETVGARYKDALELYIQEETPDYVLRSLSGIEFRPMSLAGDADLHGARSAAAVAVDRYLDQVSMNGR